MNTHEQSEVAKLREEVAALRQDIRGLLEAWRTASGVVKFVKLLGGLAMAVTAIWAMFKMGTSK